MLRGSREGLINSYRREHCKSLIETDDGEETIRALEPLDRFAGFSKTSRGIPVAKITTKWAEKFVEQRLAEGTGDAWINRSLSALIRGLNLLCERGKISVVPKIYKQAEPPARQGYIEQPAFEKLLAESPSHLKPTISMLYYTGVRKGELLAIDWSQVDLKERIIMLGEIDTKTGEPEHCQFRAMCWRGCGRSHRNAGRYFRAKGCAISGKRSVRESALASE